MRYLKIMNYISLVLRLSLDQFPRAEEKLTHSIEVDDSLKNYSTVVFEPEFNNKSEKKRSPLV